MTTLSSNQRSCCPGQRVLMPQRVLGLRSKRGCTAAVQRSSPPYLWGNIGAVTACFTQPAQSPASQAVAGPKACMRVPLAGAGVTPRVRQRKPPEDLSTPVLSCCQTLAKGMTQWQITYKHAPSNKLSNLTGNTLQLW